MRPDRVSNPGPLSYKSGALPTTLRGPARGTNHGITIIHYMKIILAHNHAQDIYNWHKIFLY